MRPVCHLHIGMNKAGSTTIQSAFHDYADPGLEYLRPDDAPTLHAVLDRTFHRPRDVADFGAGSPALARADATFTALMDRSDKAALLSSENLHAWPNRDTIEVIRARMLRHAHTLRVLAYLRPPRAYLRSSLQQRLKVKAPPPELSDLWPRYRGRLERWDSVCDAGEVTMEVLRRDRLTGGDLLDDICARIGADRARLRDGEAENAAPTLEASAILAVWHEARAAGRYGDAAPSRDDLMAFSKAVADFGSTARWGFAGPAFEDILDRRIKDIRWVEKRLDCPDFAEEPAPSVALSGLDELRDLGHRQAQPFEAWLSARYPNLRAPDTTRSDDLVQALFDHLAATRRGTRVRDRLRPLIRRLRR